VHIALFAIVHIYFKVSRKWFGRAIKGLTPASFHFT